MSTEETKVNEEEEKEINEEVNPMETLQKEIDSLQDQNLRLRAEYDNFKKRSEREKHDIYRIAEFDAIQKILPIFDDLERGIEASSADDNVRKGMEMIYGRGKEILEKWGIEEIPSQDEPFNPEFHNAVMHIEDPEIGENMVVEVFQKGYQRDGKVIRHAMVKVAN